MTRAQINDTLLQIANLEGQIKVHEDTIEQLSVDLEYAVFQDISKNNLDEGDLREINSMRSSYMVTSYPPPAAKRLLASRRPRASTSTRRTWHTTHNP